MLFPLERSVWAKSFSHGIVRFLSASFSSTYLQVKGSVEESIYQLNKSRAVHSIISGNTKNQDQPVLTLNDVESLFSPAKDPKKYDETGGSLSHLPPSVAAALAAEKRRAMTSN